VTGEHTVRGGVKLSERDLKALHELVPSHLHAGLIRYVEQCGGVGHFLTAVLSNDLSEACGRADDTSAAYLVRIVKWLYNHVPGTCWGSPEKVAAWLAGPEEERSEP
jgi:hypothetical protein